MHRFARRSPRLLWILLACLVLAGCATAPRGPDDENDPLEPFNRKVFYFNRVLDGVLIRPAAEAYRGVVPQFVQNRFRAFMNNLGEPRIFANNLLQRRFDAAYVTFSRFMLNSTGGVGGLFDVAGGEGLQRQSGDFGQTLYSWGVGEGPYLVLPLFGPSNVRDGIGLGVDLFTTAPGPYLPNSSSDAVTALRVAEGIDLRSRSIEALDVIERTALDYYAQLRSIVRQRRAAELRAARPGAKEPATDELIDPGAPAAPVRPPPGPPPEKPPPK